MILFLDFEASSLRPASWPVEIGWSPEDGATESHIIRPQPGWEDWDSAAQAVHGLTLEHLHEHGHAAGVVARRTIDVLGALGTMAFSDAPTWEQLWLGCLLREAGLPADMKVHPAQRIYQAELRRLMELAPSPEKRWHDRVVRALQVEASEMLADVYAAELQRSRIRHRAGPDSEGMRWILLEVRARVDGRLAQSRVPGKLAAPRQSL